MQMEGGPNQGMHVMIQNQNGPDPRELAPDERLLHWYVPLRSPASRRENPPNAQPWITTTAILMGARTAHQPLCNYLLQVAKRSGVVGWLKETSRSVVHAVTGPVDEPLTALQSLSVFLGWRKAAVSTGYVWAFQKVRQATAPDSWVQFLFGWRRHSALITAVITTCGMITAGVAIWRIVQRWNYNKKPFEPEGLGHSNLMTEVTQEEALATPTHFVCPAGLRAHILEKVFMQERTPNLIQRVKSIAGKWCDEAAINPFERPACIAGAVACAMTTSQLELDLLSYERRWEVRQAARQLNQHHNGPGVAPRDQPGFWQWLTRAGRR